MNHKISMTTMMVLLFVALASVGLGYALWSKVLLIDGTVNTGNVTAIFTKAFTDDDNKVNDPLKDGGDTGVCPLFGPGSCDPAASGKNVPRKDKDVGICVAQILEDKMTIQVTLRNAYPSYYCTLFFDFKNTGSVPVKVFTLAAVGPAISAGHVTARWTELNGVGQQIDPGEEVQGDLDIHVEQSAPQGGQLTFFGKIQLGQWNEFVPLSWQACIPVDGPCKEVPEVIFDGNTVVMGQLGEGDFVQNETVHGGAALLPPASSYDVTFQYHICTWDSYNTETVLGTGYWDSFSVSISAKPYWKMGYSDPVALPFVRGGNNFADGILECNDGMSTASIAGNPSGDNYLNVVLDTGTDPFSNHIHPSYGTITIEKIVVNP